MGGKNMSNNGYGQEPRASYLFPNKNEKNNPNEAIENRVQTYLKKDEYDWACQFAKTVMKHEDYPEIKIELGKTRIDDLRKYHEYLATSLDNPDTNIHFLDTLIAFNQIIRKVDMIISRVFNFKINFSTVKDNDNIVSTLDSFGYYLLQKDSPIIAEIQETYLEAVKEYQNNVDLNPIIKIEYLSIEKKALEKYKRCVGKYKSILDSIQFQPTGEYIRERQVVLERRRKHDKRTD